MIRQDGAPHQLCLWCMHTTWFERCYCNSYVFLGILVLSFLVLSVLVFEGSSDPNYTWFLVRAAGLFLYPDS